MPLFPTLETRVGRVLSAISRGLAYFGGVILIAAAVVTVVSVIGRALLFAGFGPVQGDFELVEMSCGIAIFMFLPWCQLNRGHVTVDIFISRLPARGKAAFGALGDLAIAIVSGLIMWRLYLGFAEKFPYGSDGLRRALGMGQKPYFPETTYELELPVWIPYGIATIGAAFFCIVSLYTVWRAVNWVVTSKEAVS